MAGAIFGEVAVSLFMAGAAFRENLRDSRSARCCIFHTKCVSKMGGVRSPKRRVRDDDFVVGMWSECRRIAFILVEAIQRFSAEFMNSESRGRRSIWLGWRVIPVARRIVLDVSFETRISHPSFFPWQGQYLVKLEGDSCCSAHCTGRFKCDADQT